MKNFVICILIMLFLLPTAFASRLQPIWLEPGLYEVGKDIPAGHYDVRFKELDNIVRISYSRQLNDDGSLDLTTFYSYSLTYSASEWWQAVYPIIYVLDDGYLLIEHSPCEFWPEEKRSGSMGMSFEI